MRLFFCILPFSCPSVTLPHNREPSYISPEHPPLPPSHTDQSSAPSFIIFLTPSFHPAVSIFPPRCRKSPFLQTPSLSLSLSPTFHSSSSLEAIEWAAQGKKKVSRLQDFSPKGLNLQRLCTPIALPNTRPTSASTSAGCCD